jgi:hypothetical protein
MVAYEWTVEGIDEHGDITDSDFFATAAEALAVLPRWMEEWHEARVGLVRSVGNDTDGVTDRTWAYVTGAALPERFETACGGRPDTIVPRRFHDELTAYALGAALKA